MGEVNPEFSGQFTSFAEITRFIFAGNATITLRSVATTNRYTYKIRRASDDEGKPRDFWFVSVLTGTDNETDFQYIGHINKYKNFTYGNKSRIKEDAPSVKAWKWFYPKIELYQDEAFFQVCEVWHEGRCGRCNRKLTVPESISSGFGPECINYV